tara:strand:+ start:4145 stop:4528 length:384 start_codon:yes stop_codon:yes gene_type:complete
LAFYNDSEVIAMKRRSSSDLFETRSQSLLQSYERLKGNFALKNVEDYETHLRKIMLTSMSKTDRELLDEISQHFNFISIARKPFLDSMEKLSSTITVKKRVCKRSYPPILSIEQLTSKPQSSRDGGI